MSVAAPLSHQERRQLARLERELAADADLAALARLFTGPVRHHRVSRTLIGLVLVAAGVTCAMVAASLGWAALAAVGILVAVGAGTVCAVGAMAAQERRQPAETRPYPWPGIYYPRW